MTSKAKIPVIIDTDPGIDDVVALLLALASPELEILAILVSFGASLSLVVETLARFPNFQPETKTILALGATGPLEGDLHSTQYFHGRSVAHLPVSSLSVLVTHRPRDGLGDIAERHPELNVETVAADQAQLQLTEKSGVDVALELLHSREPRSITYIALGPLTNLATLMHVDRDAVISRIDRVICMGGALDVPGNTSPVAECSVMVMMYGGYVVNFFADPYAVQELLTPKDSHPLPHFPLERFFLLPLDITTPHELRFPYYKETVDPTFHSTVVPSVPLGKSPLTHFTSSFLERTREVMLEFGKDAMELHDIVAVWCAIANAPIGKNIEDATLSPGWRMVKRKFEIERVGELTRGMLVVDRREDETAYAPGANRAHVQAELERLVSDHHHEWESTASPAQVEIEKPADNTQLSEGVQCIVETPGPDALLKLLVKRVWGIDA
ncbi:nucleoside hydrolase [Pleurotus eryngii]|uniref:Nucleoside hydrolase n=1 Tax=Pleurotus eryngii TaxID=5323 RepID=A0A9P5ZPJ2_PLEER|nr:nucleoside hydrolase [Pleurotus eryngii]